MTRSCSAKNIRVRWRSGTAAAAVALAIGAAALRPAEAPALAPLVRAYRAAPTPANRAAVEAYIAAHPADAALGQLALGITAYERKDFADAALELRNLAAALPRIADYAGYYLGAARVESGDFENAAADLAPTHAAPRSPLAGLAWIAEARSKQTTAPLEAVRTLRDHFNELPQPDGDMTLADSYQAANESAQAADFYQRVYTAYPLAPATAKAAVALAALETSMGAAYPQPLPAQLLRRADRLFELHAYTQAAAEYRAAVDKLTGLPRSQARVRAGAADLAAGNASAAYGYLTQLEIAEPEADAERLYDIEECARRLDNGEAMTASLRRLGDKYAKSGWRAKALFAAANHALAANRVDDALPLYKSVYTDFPRDGNAAVSHWKIAFHAFVRDPESAEGLLRAHLEKYPAHGTSGAAIYFLGRLYERKGDAAAARACYRRLAERFPNGYYAILARDRLGGIASTPGGAYADNTAAFLGTLQFPALAAFPTEPTPATTVRIDRSRLLRTAGLDDLADYELRFGARTDAQPALAAMELAATAGAPYRGMQAMKALAPDYLGRPVESAPKQFWEDLFPLPYRTELTAAAQAHNLDPFLVAGLIRQESEFNPSAISPANANGLMQVRLETGRQFARAAGVPRVTTGTLLEPGPNLKIGAAVFRSMLDQNGGSVERTLAAYNAGPRHAAEWSTWGAYREPAEFIESIPFTETRDYVQAVLRNAEMYRRLYGP